MLKTALFFWQVMVAFSCGSTTVEDWCNRFRREEVRQQQKKRTAHTSENINAIERVLSRRFTCTRNS